MSCEVKCPHCGKNDNVEESPVHIFENERFTMVMDDLNPFSVIGRAAANAAKKVNLYVNDKKRYYCKACDLFFEK